MPLRVLTVGTTHIQFNDSTHNVKDTVGDPEGDFNIRTGSDLGQGALVARIYEGVRIYWHQPPAAENWVAIGAHMKVTIP